MKYNPINMLQDFISKSRFSGIIIAVICFILIMLFSITPFYEELENKLYDIRFRINPISEKWEDLTFLVIDDESLINSGEYPWPRNLYARGIDVLTELGTRQTTFDFEFMEKTEGRLNEEALDDLYQKIITSEKNPMDNSDVISC